MRAPRLKASTLVAYAVVCCVLALPDSPGLGNRDVWESPHSQHEFAVWAAGLNRLGWQGTSSELQDRLWQQTNRYLNLRQVVLGPVGWLSEQVGFTQSWRMFSNPQTSPSRLWVELDNGAGFEPLYVQGSGEHHWRRPFFEHHRVRKLLGRLGREGRGADYNALGRWLARQAALEFPKAARLRIRTYTWSTEPPSSRSQAPADVEFARSGGKFTRTKTFELAEYR